MLYLARRRGVGGFSRLVALKLVHSHLLEHKGINRLFLEEARIAATIAHPNVVNVEEVGQSGGNYFIAMEYVHGVSLAELLGSLVERRLRMSPKLCVWLAAQVAEALHAAHEATGESGLPLQIVHRDVSPQNVLISHTGHIKLIDFGIADSQHTSEHDGNGRSVLGKLGYMAPEQLRMQVADRRSDVYALGVTLWEMLTSRNLFRCQRIDDERDWAVRESPPPPSKYSAIAMPALDRAVLKAIACDPETRHESALAFRAALLRAAPAAAQVDAPMFAALMRSMLGEELERRRANWPSDVSVELHLDNHDDTAPALSLCELTADMGGSDDSRAIPDPAEEDPTTVAEAPSRRSARSIAVPAYVGERGHALQAAVCAAVTPVASSEAHIDTLEVPPSDARRRAALFGARGRTLRVLGLALLCLVLGVLLGTLGSGSQPGAALGVVLKTPARAASAADTRRRPTFTVLSELTLRSTAAAEESRGLSRRVEKGEAAAAAQRDASEPAAHERAKSAPAAQERAAVKDLPEKRAPAAYARGAKRNAGARRPWVRPARGKHGAPPRKARGVARPRAPHTPDAPW